MSIARSPVRAESHVVLGQHHVRDACPILRLNLANPEKLCQGEIGERRIAGKSNQRVATELILEFAALRLAALVAPDDGTTHDFIVGVEQNRAMHLARESDTGDIVCAQTGRVESLANGRSAGSPPVLGILIGPTGSRAFKRLVLCRTGSDDLAALADDEGTGAAGTHVDA